MTDNNTITVTVKFFANFRKYGPIKSEVHFPKDVSINFILERYDVPRENQKMIILVNGLPRYNREERLKDGDTIAFFPPLAGG